MKLAVYSQLLLQVSRIAQQLLVTGILVRLADGQIYADWVLINSIVGFLAMADIGFQSVCGNRLLRLKSTNNNEGYFLLLSKVFSFHIGCMALVAVLCAVVFFSDVGRLLLHLIGIHNKDSLLVGFVLSIGYAATPIQGLVGSIYASHGDSFRGINRVTFLIVLQTVAMVCVLKMGGGLVELAISYTLCVITQIVFAFVDVQLRYKAISFDFVFFGKSEFVDVFKTAIFYFLNPLFSFAYQGLPIFLLGVIGASAGEIALFVTSRTLVGVVRQLITQVFNASSVEIAISYYSSGLASYRQKLFSIVLVCSIFGGYICGACASGGFLVIREWTGGKVVANNDLIIAMNFVILFTLCGIAFQSLAQYLNHAKTVISVTFFQFAFGAFFAFFVHYFDPLEIMFAFQLIDLCVLFLFSVFVAPRYFGVRYFVLIPSFLFVSGSFFVIGYFVSDFLFRTGMVFNSLAMYLVLMLLCTIALFFVPWIYRRFLISKASGFSKYFF